MLCDWKLNWREVFQDVIKCETNDDYTEEDVGICADNAFLNFWYVCLGDTCGAELPEGVCADECIPALEEEVAKCDGMIWVFRQTYPNTIPEAFENGELNRLEHYMCIMGPGGPGETWEKCTADCICEQPFCNCEPPEDRDQIREGFTKKWDLRDTTIICYN